MNTMTKEDNATFESMKGNYCQENIKVRNPVDSICVSLSKTSDTTIISDITSDPNHNNHGRVISLNYSAGNSAIVLETLVGTQDLNEARERNKKNKEKGSEASDKYKTAKTVTAMYHFNEFGCKIGKTALDKKREVQEIQQKKMLEARKKEEKSYYEKKRKYDEVMNLNITDENKLTGSQLRALLNMKKRKTDKTISALKKKDMLLLWREWKSRPLESPQFENEIVHSINGISSDDVTTTENNETIESPHQEERIESV